MQPHTIHTLRAALPDYAAAEEVIAILDGALATIVGADNALEINGQAGVGAVAGGAIAIAGGDSGGATGQAGAVVIDAGDPNGGTGASVSIGLSDALTVVIGAPVVLRQGINRETYVEYFEDFLMATGGANPAPWVEDLQTSCTGAEMADEPNGVYQLATTNANQADSGQLTWGDQLLIDLDKNPVIEMRVRVDGIADLESVEKIVFGVCQAHATAEADAGLDDMSHSAWFMLKGDNDLAIYVEADDGTAPLDTDDQDSTIAIVDDTWTVLQIDFASLADVKFYVDGVEQGGATVDMTGSANQNVQPIICIQRTDNTQTEAAIGVEIDYVQVRWDR